MYQCACGMVTMDLIPYGCLVCTFFYAKLFKGSYASVCMAFLKVKPVEKPYRSAMLVFAFLPLWLHEALPGSRFLIFRVCHIHICMRICDFASTSWEFFAACDGACDVIGLHFDTDFQRGVLCNGVTLILAGFCARPSGSRFGTYWFPGQMWELFSVMFAPWLGPSSSPRTSVWRLWRPLPDGADGFFIEVSNLARGQLFNWRV